MRNGSTNRHRADLRQLRLDILLLIEEQEARTIPTAPEELTAPDHLEIIATRMLDAIGGGEFRIMRKGEQTIEQRAAELAEALFDAEQRRLHKRW